MKTRFSFFLLLWGLSILVAYSQQIDSVYISKQSMCPVDNDSLSITPSMLYFQKGFSLDRDYNYEKEIKLKALKLRKMEIQSVSSVVCFLSMYGITFLLADSNNDWSLVWTIPASMAVAAGEYYLFSLWIKNIQKQIDIMQSSNLCTYKINDKVEINAVKYSAHNNLKQQAYGISINIKL